MTLSMRSLKQGKHLLTAAISSLAAVALILPLSGCSSSSRGEVNYLNSKAEITDQLTSLAEKYTKKTGIPVHIQTAAAGTNDQTLLSELSKKNGPTMFNIAGFDQYARFKPYMLNIKGTKVYSLLNSEGKNNAYHDAQGVYSLPYAAEWFGIIYNKDIIDRYTTKSYAVIHSQDELRNYQTLKAVALSMQEHAADLGIKAAFATPGMDPSDDYRFVGHMIRLPLFFQMQKLNKRFSPRISRAYLNNYKDLLDLELKTSLGKRSQIGAASYQDATGQFARGEVAFYPNGTWAYTDIKGQLDDKSIGFLPYYMGIPGEEKYGPVSIYDANWAINKRTSQQNQKATLDFIQWIITSDTGRRALSKSMGLSAPFTTMTTEYEPDNILVREALYFTARGIPSPFSVSVPGQSWHNQLVSALLPYMQGTGKWSEFESAFVTGWKDEWASYKKSVGVLPPEK